MAEAKVAIMTGCNQGIGFSTADGLLEAANANGIALSIVLACRNMQKAEAAKAKLLERHPEALVETLQLDTSDTESVLKAAAVIKERYQRVDYAYLNAGIMPTSGVSLWPLLTTDWRKICRLVVVGTQLIKQNDWDLKNGMRALFATNVLGHYLLVVELRDILMASKARLIWTSSNAARGADFRLDDIQCREGTNPYGHSKKEVDLVSHGLNDRWNCAGVYSYTVCPGLVVTQMSSALLPYWLWMSVVFAFLWLIRLVTGGFYTFFPANGSVGLLYLSGLPGTERPLVREGPMDIEPIKDGRPNQYLKYFSRTTAIGAKKVAYGLSDCNSEDAVSLLDALDTMVDAVRQAPCH